MPRPLWTTFTPILAAVLLAATWGRHPGSIVLGVVAIVLVGAVLAAVHHAEVVAHRVGEPFGSLVLAVAVTVIEVALIVTLMVTTDKDTSGLARDTVFAAVMISVNGIVGLSLLVSALKHHLARVQPRGHRRGARDRDHPGHGLPGAADVHHVGAGSGVHRRRSSRSRRSPRSCSTRCSSSPRRSVTATSSSPSTRTARTSADEDARRPRGSARQPDRRLASARPAGRLAGRRGRSGQGHLPGDRGRGGSPAASRTPSSVS